MTITRIAGNDVKRQMFGLDFDPLTLEDVLRLCAFSIATRERLLIGVLNAAKVVSLRSDVVLRDSLVDCDILLADGQAVVWASRFLKQPLPERVAGIDLFEALLGLAEREDRGVYLLGATPTVLASLEAKIGERWPRLRICGSHDGYFSDEDAGAVAREVAASGADVLFLGMPTPKKETFLARYVDALNVPVLHGVGGSFDVIAGMTKRAPAMWQRLGCEWAYRVMQEPGRLWWRYATTNPAFVAIVIRERVGRSRLFNLRRLNLRRQGHDHG